MPPTPRKRIGPGRYRDKHGIAAVVKAGGKSKEKRFPRSAKLDEIREWQDRTRRELRDAAKQHAAAIADGSLAADAESFLLLVSGAQRKEFTYLLAPWLAALGARPRHALTPADLRAVEATWGEKAASTVKHRRRALASLYRALDGEDVDHPVRRLARRREPRPAVRAIAWELAETIIGYVSDRSKPIKGHRLAGQSRSKARLRVFLYTGIPPATMARVMPEHVNLEAGTITIQPRRKGRGAPAATLPLLPQAVEALRQWLALGCAGPFDARAMGRAFRRAVKRARKDHPAIPADCKAYDLRHSFLSMVLERTGDLAAVKELGQHASMTTTLRYTQRAASPRARAAIETVVNAGGSHA